MGLHFQEQCGTILSTMSRGWIIAPPTSCESTRCNRVEYPRSCHLVRAALPTGPCSQVTALASQDSMTNFGLHGNLVVATMISQCSGLFGSLMIDRPPASTANRSMGCWMLIEQIVLTSQSCISVFRFGHVDIRGRLVRVDGQ